VFAINVLVTIAVYAAGAWALLSPQLDGIGVGR
jgi:hypothetical protein